MCQKNVQYKYRCLINYILKSASNAFNGTKLFSLLKKRNLDAFDNIQVFKIYKEICKMLPLFLKA